MVLGDFTRKRGKTADRAGACLDAPVRIGHITDANVFVTDQMPPEKVVDVCRQKGVRLEITGTADETERVEAA